MPSPSTLQSDAATDAEPGPMGTSTGFDAFISFASAQRRRASAIQRYLESAGPAGSPRMTVYLDETDIRGGDLQTELGLALDRTRQLVVCCSPEAADSRWVAAEIRRFLVHHPPHDIVLAWLAGPLERAVPAELNARELRVHDVRRWWFDRWPRPSPRIELARMYARLADLPLRDVVDWERRRTLARLSGAAGLAAALVVASGSAVLHQSQTSEASVLLDRLAVEQTRDDALRAIRYAPMAIRQRAIAIVAAQPARAAVVVQSGWPVSAIGLEGHLAADLLRTLRDALTTTEGEAIPVPRLQNYRYALAIVQAQEVLRREAQALLNDVVVAKEATGHPDSIYWLRARRSALLVGYVDLLQRLDEPRQQLEGLRKLSKGLDGDSADVADALEVVESVLRKRGVLFEPLRAPEEASGESRPPPSSAPPSLQVDAIEALRTARAALASETRLGLAAAAYALRAGSVNDRGVLDSEIVAINAQMADARTRTEQRLELLKMMAVLAARRGDDALVKRVASLLAAALGRPAAPTFLKPELRGGGFVNFPAPLQRLPARLLATGDPAALVHFVATYASLSRPGMAWSDLEKAVDPWKDVTTILLGSTQVINLVREELGYLDRPLYAPWGTEIRRNCVEWLAHVEDTPALRALLDDLARLILADLAGDRVGHLLAIYEAAATRLWVDLRQPPDAAAVAQVIALLPHPMWHSRIDLVDSVRPTWGPDIGYGLAPFIEWAQRTHKLRVAPTAPAPSSASASAR